MKPSLRNYKKKQFLSDRFKKRQKEITTIQE